PGQGAIGRASRLQMAIGVERVGSLGYGVTLIATECLYLPLLLVYLDHNGGMRRIKAVRTVGFPCLREIVLLSAAASVMYDVPHLRDCFRSWQGFVECRPCTLLKILEIVTMCDRVLEPVTSSRLFQDERDKRGRPWWPLAVGVQSSPIERLTHRAPIVADPQELRIFRLLGRAAIEARQLLPANTYELIADPGGGHRPAGRKAARIEAADHPIA